MFFVRWFWFFNVLLLGFTDISDSCGNYFHLLNIDTLIYIERDVGVDTERLIGS